MTFIHIQNTLSLDVKSHTIQNNEYKVKLICKLNVLLSIMSFVINHCLFETKLSLLYFTTLVSHKASNPEIRTRYTNLASLPARLSVCLFVRRSDCPSVCPSVCSAKLEERLNHKNKIKTQREVKVGHSVGTKVKTLGILSLAYYNYSHLNGLCGILYGDQYNCICLNYCRCMKKFCCFALGTSNTRISLRHPLSMI